MSSGSPTFPGHTVGCPLSRAIGTESALTRAHSVGIVGLEGGGTAPHPLGGGVAWGRRKDGRGGTVPPAGGGR